MAFKANRPGLLGLLFISLALLAAAGLAAAACSDGGEGLGAEALPAEGLGEDDEGPAIMPFNFNRPQRKLMQSYDCGTRVNYEFYGGGKIKYLDWGRRSGKSRNDCCNACIYDENCWQWTFQQDKFSYAGCTLYNGAARMRRFSSRASYKISGELEEY